MWRQYSLAATVSLAVITLFLASSASQAIAAEPVVIVKPAAAEWLEEHAAEELAKYAKAITGTAPQIKTDAEVADPAVGSVYFILGPAERNKLAAKLVQQKRLADLEKLPPHAEGFVRICEEPPGAAKVVLLAGRQPLGTLYAVYDHLESQCGVGFFQDGEHVPSLAALPIGNVSTIEQPRFDNRMHFCWNAHEGIKKYHSYWWTLDDWKREFDWMAKRRMNMIRIDLWYYTHFVGDAYELAFPEIGPETQGESYVALAGFPHDWAWPPKYRREMTKEMIAYGRKLGIRFIYCLDYATVPLRFVKVHPDYKYMGGNVYGESRQLDPSDPHAVEVEKKYLSKIIELFGTDHLYLYSPYAELDVGGGSPDKNLEMRIKAANGILKMLADVDPKSVWVTDTWDMLFSDRWGPARIKKYLDSFPIEKIYLYNTSADADTPPLSKENSWWYGKKWAFGVINAFAGEDNLRGDPVELIARVQEAAAQSNCTGLFMVPEMTHYNIMFWDLVTHLAWQPANVDFDRFLQDYCVRRYGAEFQKPMVEAWRKVAQAVLRYRPYRGEGFRIARMYRHYPWYHWTTKEIGNSESAPMLTETEAILKEQTEDLRQEIPLLREALDQFLAVRARQKDNAVYTEDAVVLFRTYAAKCFNWETSCAYFAFKAGDKAALAQHHDRAMEILGQIRDVLALCPSYSINKTIAEAASVPGSNKFIPEMIRQACINWDYVSNDVYEQFDGYYVPRMKAYFDTLEAKLAKGEKTAGWGDVAPNFPDKQGDNYLKHGWIPKEPQTGDPIERITGFMKNLAEVNPSPAKAEAAPSAKEANPMKLLQPTPGCSDIDVVLPGSDKPALRLLLPGTIRAQELGLLGALHMVPGAWTPAKDGLKGTITVKDQVQLTVTLSRAQQEVRVSIKVKNLTGKNLNDVYAGVSASPSHLPGVPDWSNEAFFPKMPLDRTAQGKIWYEKIAPHGLQAWTSRGWVAMHPKPDAPSAEGVPDFSVIRSRLRNAYACAAVAPDGKTYLYQAWNRPSYYLAPFVGNASMDLEVFVAATIPPGGEAEIQGLAGVHQGTWESLAAEIRKFRESGKAGEAAAKGRPAKDRTAGYTVATISKTPSWQQNYAATELAKYIGKITGKPVKVVPGDASADFLIGNKGEAAGIDVTKMPDSPDAFIIRSVDAGVAIIGATDIAAVYGAYHYLDACCDVGFFEDGEAVPRLSQLPLDDIDMTEAPKFRDRIQFAWDARCLLKKSNSTLWRADVEWKDYDEWMVKNKFNWMRYDLHCWRHGYGVYAKAHPGYERPDTGFCPKWWTPDYVFNNTKQSFAYAKQLGIHLLTDGEANGVPVSATDLIKKEFPDAVYSKPDPTYPMAVYIRDKKSNVAYYERNLKAVIDNYGMPDMNWAQFPVFEEEACVENTSAWDPDLSNPMSAVVKKLEPHPRFLIDGWLVSMRFDGNPKGFKALLDKLNYDYVINTSYNNNSDLAMFQCWEYFWGKPFHFTMIDGFGGDDHLHLQYKYGNILVWAKDALTHPGSNCVGFGTIPELIGYDPMFRYFIARMAWNPFKYDKWEDVISEYTLKRYGQDSYENMYKSELLLIWSLSDIRIHFDPYIMGYTPVYRFNIYQAYQIVKEWWSLYVQGGDVKQLYEALTLALKEKDRQKGNVLYDKYVTALFHSYASEMYKFALLRTYSAYTQATLRYQKGVTEGAEVEKYVKLFDAEARKMDKALQAIEMVWSTRPELWKETDIKCAMSVPGAAPQLVRTIKADSVTFSEGAYETLALYYRPVSRIFTDDMKDRLNRKDKTFEDSKPILFNPINWKEDPSKCWNMVPIFIKDPKVSAGIWSTFEAYINGPMNVTKFKGTTAEALSAAMDMLRDEKITLEEYSDMMNNELIGKNYPFK